MNICLIHGGVNGNTLRKRIKEPGTRGCSVMRGTGEQGRGRGTGRRIVPDLKILKQVAGDLRF
jgi:hypothetical protein